MPPAVPPTPTLRTASRTHPSHAASTSRTHPSASASLSVANTVVESPTVTEKAAAAPAGSETPLALAVRRSSSAMPGAGAYPRGIGLGDTLSSGR